MNDILIKNIVDYLNRCTVNITKNKYIIYDYEVIDNNQIIINLHPELHSKYFNLIILALKNEFKDYIKFIYISQGHSVYDLTFNITLKDIKEIRFEKINKFFDDRNI